MIAARRRASCGRRRCSRRFRRRGRRNEAEHSSTKERWGRPMSSARVCRCGLPHAAVLVIFCWLMQEFLAERAFAQGGPVETWIKRLKSDDEKEVAKAMDALTALGEA